MRSGGFSGDPQASTELVVHDVGDFSLTVPTKAPLAIVVGDEQRILPNGYENVSLTTTLANKRVTFPGYRDHEIGTLVETIFTDVFVQQATAHLLGELLRWREPDEVAAHGSRQSAPDA